MWTVDSLANKSRWKDQRPHGSSFSLSLQEQITLRMWVYAKTKPGPQSSTTALFANITTYGVLGTHTINRRHVSSFITVGDRRVPLPHFAHNPTVLIRQRSIFPFALSSTFLFNSSFAFFPRPPATSEREGEREGENWVMGSESSDFEQRVLGTVKSSQERRDPPLIWAMEVSKCIQEKGLGIPNPELGQVLVSNLCFTNNNPTLWKFVEQGICSRLLSPLHVLALLTSRYIYMYAFMHGCMHVGFALMIFFFYMNGC